MKPDENRLTAYLLGEINDPDECQRIEAAIHHDAELAQMAKELRHINVGLTEAFQQEPVEGFPIPAFHSSFEHKKGGIADASSRTLWLPLLSGVAASLALVSFLLLLQVQKRPMGERSSERVVEVEQAQIAVGDSDFETWITGDTQMRNSYAQDPSIDSGSPLPWLTAGFGRLFPESQFADSGASWFKEERDFSQAFVEPVSRFPTQVSALPFRFLEASLDRGFIPDPKEIHIESLVNAIPYDYEKPATREIPLSVHLEQAISPWINKHQLLRVGLQGYGVPWEERPDCNLVFLIDVSGSMDERIKLPLIKGGIETLVTKLRPHERIAIVTYGGASEVILPSTLAARRERIQESLDQLVPGGSTLAQAGILEAYRIAVAGFLEGGNNQIVVCTDGDFTLGTSDFKSLRKLVTVQASRGILLSTYGFGMESGRSSRMERLARSGNGHFAYIDSPAQLDQLFVGQISGSTISIARDVTVEVEFNPAKVDAYRLIGWNGQPEQTTFNTRQRQRFRDVSLSSDYSLTALYELIPSELAQDPKALGGTIADLPGKVEESWSTEPVTVRVYYQNSMDGESEVLEIPLTDEAPRFEKASSDFRFAAAAAGFGQLLRNSRHKGDVNFDWILSTARNALGHNRGGYRTSFMEMVIQAEAITQNDSSAAEE